MDSKWFQTKHLGFATPGGRHCSAQHCLDLWTIRHAIRYAIRHATRHAIRYAIRHALRHAIRMQSVMPRTAVLRTAVLRKNWDYVSPVLRHGSRERPPPGWLARTPHRHGQGNRTGQCAPDWLNFVVKSWKWRFCVTTFTSVKNFRRSCLILVWYSGYGSRKRPVFGSQQGEQKEPHQVCIMNIQLHNKLNFLKGRQSFGGDILGTAQGATSITEGQK